MRIRNSTIGRGSVKRSGTAASDYEKQSIYGSPRSIRTFASSIGGNNNHDTSLEIIERKEIPGEYYDENDDEEGEGYEDLENVRACCSGKHDVGSLSRKNHNHNHNHSEHNRSANSSTNSRNSFQGTNLNPSRRVAVPTLIHSRKSSNASFGGSTPLATIQSHQR